MLKRKTHKGLKKRFKVTANGKIKHRNAGRGHILSSKTPKRKRHLRQDGVISGVRARMIIDGLRASL